MRLPFAMEQVWALHRLRGKGKKKEVKGWVLKHSPPFHLYPTWHLEWIYYYSKRPLGLIMVNACPVFIDLCLMLGKTGLLCFMYFCSNSSRRENKTGLSVLCLQGCKVLTSFFFPPSCSRQHLHGQSCSTCKLMMKH